MKNFSVKTADFDSLSISGESPIVQSDLGTAPNQIPLNKDLGSLAYMNAPQIEDLNVDTLELREIAAEMSDTAVDVFVYDTRKDSDGGAWRSRTQHTSWYNEELNTATRGGRREFPAVAVIVAEVNKVTIYDGDDPDLSMWMVFNASGGRMIWATQLSCVSSLNARLSIGSPASGFRYIDFVSDKMREWRTSGVNSISGDISERNSGNLTLIDIPGQDVIVNQIINDVAMTVLSNAPIDTGTGLPIPTIAVATDGGVSVIRDDGNVVDYTCTYYTNNKYSLINFIGDSKLLACSRDGETYPTVFDIPGQDKASFDSTDIVFAANPSDSSSAADIRVGNYSDYKASAVTKENIAMGGTSLIISNIDNVSGDQTADNVIISSSYNTGWMPGDIKLATLSDTKNEKVGVDETTELIVDGSGNWVGDFDVAADVSEWTGSGGTIDGSLGYVRITQTTNSTAYLTIPINTVVGKKYKISADIRTSVADTVNTGAAFYIGETAYQNDVALRRPMVSEGSFSSFSLEFVATTSVTHITLASWAQSGDHVEFDNVSVKQTGELITNGTFDDGTEGWTEYDPNNHVSISHLSSGKLRITSDTTTNSAIWAAQSIDNFIVGETYVVSADITINGTATASVILHDSWIANFPSITSSGHYSFTFKPVETQHEVRTYVSAAFAAGSTVDFDNVSIRLAEDDRSVNDNGLQVFGEINKAPVAPGAELVAYSGFSADDYLMQPYNPDLDFGTGDFCVMGWVKSDGSIVGDNYLYVRGEYNGGWSGPVHYAYFQASSGGKLRWRISDDGDSTRDELESSSAISSSWTHICLVRQSSNLYMYINGSLDVTGSISNASSSLDNTSANFILGVHPALSTSLVLDDVSVSLFRISATAPTAEQIAKIYRDEKVLFQDGAQATLYGTSDAVTALAYDDSDDLLHVGTASGRSSFNGLKRVDNTTTAVTTAISATEGLVIEQ